MGIWTRLSFSFRVSLFFNFWFILKILRIFEYATASTNSAAYIIGGYYDEKVSTIAQFKDNIWLKIGDLNEKKDSLSAIFHDGEYLIVGGDVYSGRLVNLFKIIFLQSWNIAIDSVTESDK